MFHAPSELAAAASLQLPTTTELGLAHAQLELTHWRTRLRFEDLTACAVYPRGADRSYVRLPSRAGCEAWLISWPPGARAPLHDHGGASALATMLSGELKERLQTYPGTWVERCWRRDARIEIPSHARHEVWNASEQTAYSLHVYSPRLASMTFYEHTESGELRALHSEAPEQW